MSEREPELIAYRIGPAAPRIQPAAAGRDWMDATSGRYAYRCLPLSVANQNGWVLLNPCRFEVIWNGSAGSAGLRFRLPDSDLQSPVTSVFGTGIVTFRIPILFRTPPGYDLLVRGPANHVKRGVVALDGLVETDWSVATFTMNWKLTEPLRWISFARDEPFCMVVPMRRHDLEAFRPELRDLDSDPGLAADYRAWARARERFVFDRMATPPDERKPEWQRDYFKGEKPDGARAPEHRVKVELREFGGSQDGSQPPAKAAVWDRYAERTPGLDGQQPWPSRARNWLRFWLGALRS